MRRWTAITLTTLLLAAASPRTAAASMEKTFTYRYQVIWSTAIRLIRADRGYPVSDSDKDNGYILFTYPGSGAVKECSATMELFDVVDPQGYRRVQVKLRIAHQPSYIELNLLEALEKKLQSEQGDPPPAQQARPKKPAPTSPKAPKEGDRSGDKGGDKGGDKEADRGGKRAADRTSRGA